MKDLFGACIQSPSGGVVTPAYVDETLNAAADPVDLVVLPELCTVPYFPLERGSRDAADAVPLDGPEIAAFGSVAKKHGCHLMLGTYLQEGARRFNAALLVGPDGSILEGHTSAGGEARSFHKMHLCDVQLPGADFCESSYFDEGDEYVVWQTPFGCVGALVCYDRHFPEAWVTLRAMGAEIICVPTTSPIQVEVSFHAEMQAMSLQQSVYALTANRVGVEVLRTSGRRTEFLGSSCITGPFGECLISAEPRQPRAMVSTQLTADHLEAVRRSHQFHEHRRPATYVGASTRAQEAAA
jgi:beta-ureidopropionase